MTEKISDSFEERIAYVRQRIADACSRSDRVAADVLLIAVSKTHAPETIDQAINAGLDCFGENRVQEAAAKIPRCGMAEWHLVGHLQRNKTRAALELFSTIHSVDSIRLLETIARVADESGARPRLLLEVNVAGEAAKFGFDPGDVAKAIMAAGEMGAPPIAGLMTMPPFSPDPEHSRRYFSELRELRDRVTDETGAHLPELSMGMSGDFEVAIEEGATMIRVGTLLFGQRTPWSKRREI